MTRRLSTHGRLSAACARLLLQESRRTLVWRFCRPRWTRTGDGVDDHISIGLIDSRLRPLGDRCSRGSRRLLALHRNTNKPTRKTEERNDSCPKEELIPNGELPISAKEGFACQTLTSSAAIIAQIVLSLPASQ